MMIQSRLAARVFHSSHCLTVSECHSKPPLEDVVFEPVANKFLISASSDATFALWQ